MGKALIVYAFRAGTALRLKSAGLGGGLKMAQDYGREIAKKMER
jgi:hypothetical protein